MPPTDWTGFARAAARNASENWFDVRLGVMTVEAMSDVLVVFNNHFFANFPTLQAVELEELKRRLSAEGFEVLGSASYPTSGASDGYSYAIVIDAGEEYRELIEDIQREVHRWAFEKT
jgi:hypothetical protein